MRREFPPREGRPETPAGEEHFDALAGMLFLDGELAAERALEVARHAETCTACGSLLAGLESEARHLRAALLEPAGAELAMAETAAMPAVRPAVWPSRGLRAAVIGGWGAAAAAMAAAIWAASGAGAWADWGLRALFDGVFWPSWGGLLAALRIPALAALVGMAWLAARARARRQGRLGWGRGGAHIGAIGGLGGGMGGGVLGIVLGLLLLAPAPARAAETIHTQIYTLPAGQTIANDLFISADTARIDGVVEGDLVTATRKLIISGRVTGNVITFTRYLDISGQIGGGVQAFTETMRVSGTIAGGLYDFSHHLELSRTGRVGGGATVLADNLDLDGEVGRDLWGGFGHLAEISGRVAGATDLHAPTEIGRGARLEGPVTIYSQNPPVMAAGAALPAGWRFHRVSARNWRTWSFYWGQILRWAAAFLVGWVLLLLFPGFAHRSERAAHSAGWALGVGVAVLAATPVVVGLLAVTMIGIPLAVILALTYVVALYLAEIMVGLWLGRALLPQTIVAAAWPALAVGLAIERAAVNLPLHIGFVIWAAILIFGLGLQALALRRSWRREVEVPNPAYSLA